MSQLVTTYRDGDLVPFLGSGMSMGVCASWSDMLIGLLDPLELSELKKKVTKAIVNSQDSGILYRVADELIVHLEARPFKDWACIYRKSLRYKQKKCNVPPDQTKELTNIFFPLVITTNYDDVYWMGMKQQNKQLMPPPKVLGRDRQDCHEVLSSLDSDLEPLLWCIQGFFGGQLTKPECVVPNSRKREQLLRQVVLGHRQYQRAINDDHNFRRAFAEVYRRRSLLFLGSGISEPYLINLFSEIRHHYGSNRRPHFAFVKRDGNKEDDYRFMELRLGIVPILYDCHDELPNVLKLLAHEIRGIHRPVSKMKGMNYQISRTKFNPIEVKITNKGLEPIENEAIIVSVGKKTDNKPLLGTQAKSVINAYNEKNNSAIKCCDWNPIDDKSRIFGHKQEQSLFAVAARTELGDNRDLGVIPETLNSALKEVAKEYEVIHVGTIASGRDRPWHPVHPFAQMLCGVRRFISSNNTRLVTGILLHVVDWRVWFAISADKLKIPELLFSGLVTYSIDVESGIDEYERFSMTMPENQSLNDLLDRCGMSRDQWKAEITPSMGKNADKDVCGDVVVPPTAIVVLRRR